MLQQVKEFERHLISEEKSKATGGIDLRIQI